MKKNMGTADRIIRAIIAVVVGYLFFTDAITGIVGGILLGLAVIFLLTSFVSFCPLYTIFGASTCKVEN